MNEAEVEAGVQIFALAEPVVEKAVTFFVGLFKKHAPAATPEDVAGFAGAVSGAVTHVPAPIPEPVPVAPVVSPKAAGVLFVGSTPQAHP